MKIDFAEKSSFTKPLMEVVDQVETKEAMSRSVPINNK